MVTLVAFESLAVITILPHIAEDLGGIAWYGWVSTAFFLGTMVGIVFAGEQADRHGAGRPYVVGLVLFAIGLGVGGLAPSMPILVVGRFVQGLGAGVVPAIGYVAIGRVYTVERRARMFAVLSTAWVVPGVIGPALAERISSWVGWRWVFIGLLPFVALAGLLIVPEMMRLTALRAGEPEPVRFLRRRLVEAARVAGGAALIVAGFTASRWLLVPAMIGGLLVGVGPLRRLTPPGTLSGAPGVPAVILSRGLLTFAFFGTDTFVPARPDEWAWDVHVRRQHRRDAGHAGMDDGCVGSGTLDRAHRRRAVRAHRLSRARPRHRHRRRGGASRRRAVLDHPRRLGRGRTGHGAGVRRTLAGGACVVHLPSATARRPHRCSCSTTSAWHSARAPWGWSSRLATISGGIRGERSPWRSSDRLSSPLPGRVLSRRFPARQGRDDRHRSNDPARATT